MSTEYRAMSNNSIDNAPLVRTVEFSFGAIDVQSLAVLACCELNLCDGDPLSMEYAISLADEALSRAVETPEVRGNLGSVVDQCVIIDCELRAITQRKESGIWSS